MQNSRFTASILIVFLLLLCLGAAGAKNDTGAPLPPDRFRLTTAEMMMDTTGKVESYPTYATQLINLANRNAQATRPAAVGQMSELIREFPGDSYGKWVDWYTKQHPDAIDTATERTYAMIEKMRSTLNSIDRKMVRRWVSELILAKTYVGLRFQRCILKRIADMEKKSFRLANPDEEAKGIDGFIGTRPVSVKPVSYRTQPVFQDRIDVDIIYYEKIRGGIDVYYNRQK